MRHLNAVEYSCESQNCTIKPPAPSALRGRHRRLCRVCNKAPLRNHTQYLEGSSSSSTSFTSEAFSREPCQCAEIVYVCISCGNALRSADTTYMRGWTWRTRYSTYLGGLGTGIGEGNEGVECGKGDQCLAAKEIEKEIDCDGEELANLQREFQKVSGNGKQREGTSYLAQEMEGIGGVVKKKVKKRVKVGAVVKEYEDERDDGLYLKREHQGLSRSWCCWCSRVIPSLKDARESAGTHELTHITTNGSSSSSVNINDGYVA